MARPAVLSVDRITGAGVELIAAGGLEALTMRAVAGELGTSATALYRHVADRDELLTLILDRIAAGLPVEVPGRTPRARLERRWTGAADYLGRYRWVLRILIEGERVSAGALPFTDACLEDLLEAGLTPARAAQAHRMVWSLLTGTILTVVPERAPGAARTQRDAVMDGFDRAALPSLARTWNPAGRRTPERDFRTGLAAMLDGLLPAG